MQRNRMELHKKGQKTPWKTTTIIFSKCGELPLIDRYTARYQVHNFRMPAIMSMPRRIYLMNESQHLVVIIPNISHNPKRNQNGAETITTGLTEEGRKVSGGDSGGIQERLVCVDGRVLGEASGRVT